jgi:hypothetical protein
LKWLYYIYWTVIRVNETLKYLAEISRKDQRTVMDPAEQGNVIFTATTHQVFLITFSCMGSEDLGSENKEIETRRWPLTMRCFAQRVSCASGVASKPCTKEARTRCYSRHPLYNDKEDRERDMGGRERAPKELNDAAMIGW